MVYAIRRGNMRAIIDEEKCEERIFWWAENLFLIFIDADRTTWLPIEINVLKMSEIFLRLPRGHGRNELTSERMNARAQTYLPISGLIRPNDRITETKEVKPSVPNALLCICLR